MNIYNISKGQLIILWIIGFIICFGVLVEIDNWNNTFIMSFLFWGTPLILLFYTFGWKNNRKK